MPPRKEAAPDAPGGDESGLPQAARNELAAWFERHCKNSAISRDTAIYNQIFQNVTAINSALTTLEANAKE